VIIVRYGGDFDMSFSVRGGCEPISGADSEVEPEAARGQNPVDRVRAGYRHWITHIMGKRRPETFAFLGFTYYCGKTRDGRFVGKRKTQSKRLTVKLSRLDGSTPPDAFTRSRTAPVAYTGLARALCLL
jgi:hypothetical protein